jgi:hypothetical protein
MLLFTMGLLVASGIGAHAQNYPWCSTQYGTNCGFSTLAQCQASSSGTQQCVKNTEYVPPGPATAGSHNKQKKAPKQ